MEQTPDVEIEEAQRADRQSAGNQRPGEEERRTEWVGRGVDEEDGEDQETGDQNADIDDTDDSGDDLRADEDNDTEEDEDAPSGARTDKSKFDGNRPRP